MTKTEYKKEQSKAKTNNFIINTIKTKAIFSIIKIHPIKE